MTGSDRHPTFCATRGPVPCGDHLAEPTVILTLNGGRVEIAAERTRNGTAAVALTVVDGRTGRAVTVDLRRRDVDRTLHALVSHDDLSRGGA